MNENPVSYARRLPVYLLVDCSASMAGEPIEAVRRGIESLVSYLRGDSVTLDTVFVSVITFDSAARRVTPLTSLVGFELPPIQVNAGCSAALGAAMRLLASCVTTEVRQSTPAQKGDYRPLVIIITDGKPSDENEIRDVAVEFRSMNLAGNLICVAGPSADSALLTQVMENVQVMDSFAPGQIAAFFTRLSSIFMIGRRNRDAAPAAAPGAAVDMPPPPPGFKLLP